MSDKKIFFTDQEFEVILANTLRGQIRPKGVELGSDKIATENQKDMLAQKFIKGEVSTQQMLLVADLMNFSTNQNSTERSQEIMEMIQKKVAFQMKGDQKGNGQKQTAPEKQKSKGTTINTDKLAVNAKNSIKGLNID